MANITKSIDIDRPVRAVYDQWTQFEEFPQFMQGVTSVRQLSETELRWDAEIAGVHRQWDAKITQQEPDRVVAWSALSGPKNAGRVLFRPISAGQTRVDLTMEFDPDGVVEAVGDKVGFVSRRIEGDLERFREFIEERQAPTGGWRGEVQGGVARSPEQGEGSFES